MKSNTEFELIPLESIDVMNRYRQDYKNITQMKEDILKIGGLINPITVLRRRDNRFTLVTGGRRVQALRSLRKDNKLESIYPNNMIPATFMDDEVNTNDMRIIELMENVSREDMNTIEMAQARADIHKALVEDHIAKTGIKGGKQSWSIRQSAAKLGLSHTQLSDDIKLSAMADDMPQLKKAKNKNEAVKMLDKTLKTAETVVKVAAIKQEESKKTTNDLAKLLDSRYVTGDTFKIGTNIDNETLDLVECDSPFGIDLRNQTKGDRSDTSESAVYNEWGKTDYKTNMKKICQLSYSKLKPNGWFILWFAPEPWFEFTYQAMIGAGFLGLRVPGLWVKPGGQCNNPHLHLANSCEYFFIGRKPDSRIFKEGRSNIFQVPPVYNKEHRTEKPVLLMELIYSTFCGPGSKIWIPFLGSGNGIISAHNVQMSAFGSDISPVYKDRFTVKVHEQFK